MSPEEIMQMAIAEAEKSETPFGAVIVKDNEIVEKAGNTVESDADPSCHAEVNVLRKLTKRLKTAALESGYTLYSTCEPCAMCAATIFWAGVSEIVYGAGASDFEDDYNPNMINMSCEEVITKSPASIKIKSGILKEECKKLHSRFPL
ncbi:cytosine/adenosine deaminase [Rivularia sp. PCC 7116]|uniref:nucleoside deaminase n=1 Tax=Rivularia sp. PCC 7116 TaxID=373994 RepID=UPI00029F2BD1|nr:nucleoside deaminase [Rivularia sp. PCC 7116]AFY58384.1 cytosine/adenosine deaminase [Rivularia sp. PCC 7116]